MMSDCYRLQNLASAFFRYQINFREFRLSDFGVSDICIVAKHIFDLSVELNLAILKKVVIVHQSGETFLPVLFFSFNHLNSDIRNSINANMSVLKQTTQGKNILDMFNNQVSK